MHAHGRFGKSVKAMSIAGAGCYTFCMGEGYFELQRVGGGGEG